MPSTSAGRRRRRMPAACQSAPARRKGAFSKVANALAAQTLDADPLHLEAMLGHQPGLHAALGADPEHLHPLRAQQLRDGEGGKDMTAGSTGHDTYARAHRIPRLGPASDSS